ncbi:MAG: ATP phosphoribosyltransferase [bacterium]
MSLKIGLPKGRMLEDAVNILKKCGLDFSSALSKSRKLRFFIPSKDVEAIIIRNVDLLTYVEYGAVDIGIIGYDLVMEQKRDVITALDLNFGRCRLSVAGVKGNEVMRRADLSGIKVATKYPDITSEYFKKRGFQVEVIKLYGAIELAPLFGLSDLIVDLVSTGETLKTNGLEELEVIMHSSARLVINKASMRTKQEHIDKIISQLRKVI